MNLGQQTGHLLSTASIINSLDEVTREKVLAELPEELKCRLIAEQHAASRMAAARLNLDANSPKQILASTVLNLSTPERVGCHAINSFKVPVAGLCHPVLRTCSSGAAQNISVYTAGANPNYGTPSHHSTARLPTGSSMSNMSFTSTLVNGTNSQGFIGGHCPGLRVSGSSLCQGFTQRSMGTSLNLSFGSNGPGASTSHSFNPREGMIHNTAVITAGRQLGGPPTVNMQINNLPRNSVHLATSQRFSTLPGSFSSRINGHPMRHKQIISTYLDDFKQGFPSKGLSVVSSRWWGNAEPDRAMEKLSDIENSSPGGSETDGADLRDRIPARCGSGLSITTGRVKEAIEVLKSCRRLTRSRRRAAVVCKRALMSGAGKGYGTQKLGDREVSILQFVFGESLPGQWIAAHPASSCS